MKIKMVLFLILTVLFIFLINLANTDKEIYYVNIDTTNSLNYNKEICDIYNKKKRLEKYVNQFSIRDFRTTDLVYAIEDNIEINHQTIQNALIKADIITLYVGINDINYKINGSKEELYNYTDQVIDDIEKLFKLIRTYTKEKIYYIGFKNEYGLSYNEFFDYTNKRIKSLCNEYEIIFVNINNNKSVNQNVIDKIFTK